MRSSHAPVARCSLAVSVAALCFGSPAGAATINFLISPVPTSAGTVSYAGGAAPLIGLGIEVDLVNGSGTLLNDGESRFCIECSLSFETGEFIGGGPTTWVFLGGGSLSILGGVDLNGDGDALDPGDIPVGTELLSGSFTAFPITVDVDPGLDSIVGVTFASFNDVKEPLLTEFFGFPDGTYEGEMFLFFGAEGEAPGPFESLFIAEGLVANIAEPHTLLLLASGLLLGCLGRKSRAAGGVD